MVKPTVSLSRRRIMQSNRSKNTLPELLVRSALHARGLRFRLHRKDLPGKPDIVLPKYHLCILVNGCFWHQHKGCKLSSTPKVNTEYWGPKLRRNIERDSEVIHKLKSIGWKVKIIWECEARDKEKLAEIINDLQKQVN